MIDKITNRSKQIAAFPLSGRIVGFLKNENVREIIEGNYRIVYHINDEQIDIVAVVHTSRDTVLG
jgi:toxin ParE1/3/4